MLNSNLQWVFDFGAWFILGVAAALAVSIVIIRVLLTVLGHLYDMLFVKEIPMKDSYLIPEPPKFVVKIKLYRIPGNKIRADIIYVQHFQLGKLSGAMDIPKDIPLDEACYHLQYGLIKDVQKDMNS